jgi:hypothetical protein
MEGQQFETGGEEVDVSDDFLNQKSWEFLDRLRELRKASALKIDVDLSAIEDKDRFVGLARRLKAFVEDARNGQQRAATVHGRREQISWEPNVFCSGVEFVVEEEKVLE